MAYIGKTPTPVPLTSSDIASDIINSTHIGDTAISGFDALATAPASTDEFLISDAGVLKRLDASLIGGGGILQVKSVTKTDTQTYSSSTTRSDITGLSLNITPSSSSNKILVRFMVNHWGNDSHCQIERSIASGSYSIISEPTSTQSNQTKTHSGGSHRNTYELNTATMEVLDNPNTTSAITYKMTFNNGPAGGGSGYINRSSNDENDANGERAISTITAMEIDSGVL